MKKTVLYLCAGVLVLGLTACGGKDPDGNDSSQGTEQTESLENSGDNTEGTESTGEQNTESTGTDADDQQSGADDQQGDADNSDGSETGWSQEMTEIRDAVKTAVGETNYWPDTPMDPELFETFYGISADMYEDYLAESPMISNHVDALIVVKAKEDQVDGVYDILSAYKERLMNDTMQYPANLGKIQASQVEKVGNYVIFVQLGGATPDDEEEAITQCQEANQQALDAIREKIGQ